MIVRPETAIRRNSAALRAVVSLESVLSRSALLCSVLNLLSLAAPHTAPLQQKEVSPMLGVQQIGAVLKRNAIEKKRNTRVTCCECCSHLFIILLLIYGYALSEVLYFDAEKYSTISVTIPPFKSADDTSSINEALDILNGPLPIPSFDAFIGVSQLINPSNSEDILDLLDQTDIGRRFGNLVQEGALHFAPAGPEVASLVEYLNTTTLTFSTMTHHIHDSENAAIDYIQKNLDEYAFALIVLPGSDVITDQYIQYKIRQNYTTLPNTNRVVNWISIGLDTEYQKYLLSGFLTLQKTIDAWAFNYTQGLSEDGEEGGSSSQQQPQCPHPQYWTMPFPTAAYDQNIFFQAVGFLLGLAMIMATMYPVSKLIKGVVEEKESKMREVMKIMGLRSWAHQVSWTLTAFLLFLWIALSTAYLCSTSFLPNSDFRLIFLFLFTFCLSEITFSFLIASFFSKAKLAAIIGPVCLFCSILPRYIFFGTNRYEEQQAKYFASLLSPSAFSFGADILADYEYSGVGVQFSNIDDGLYNFRGCIQIMFFDFLWYGLLAWYFDQVIPNDVGTPLHPLFLFHKSYWCPKSQSANMAIEDNEDDLASLLREHGNHPDAPPASHVEPILPTELEQVKVLITGLQKQYGDGKFGVKHLSVAMLKDQITCLLGHNGAGKTTTISMLTGLVRATAGDSLIWGQRLSSDLQNIRQTTGICPQQNVLFPFLTVEEHLYFFCRVKGVPERDIPSMVFANMVDVGLLDKRSVPTHALSGGMKRKTCLAIALCGNPLTVFLDEPTSGMDPYSRRSTWELLQKKKKDRVIILTTHFLEEAEILGDRIVIMSEGKLRCSGSTLFLKSRFGAGYVLTITTESDTSSIAVGGGSTVISGVEGMSVEKQSGSREEEGSSKKNAATNALLALVQSHVPSATVYSSIGAELLLELPVDSSPHFPALFASLKQYATARTAAASTGTTTIATPTAASTTASDAIPGKTEEGGLVTKFNASPPSSSAVSVTASNPDLHISSYGVQYVTLEQVFIRLAEAEKIEGQTHEQGEGQDQRTVVSPSRVEREYDLSKSPMMPPSPQISFREEKGGEGTGMYDPVTLEEHDDMQVLELEEHKQQAVEMVTLGGRGSQSETDSDTSSPRKTSQVMPVMSEHNMRIKNKNSGSSNNNDFLCEEEESPNNIMFIQLYELFRKRFIIARRDKKGMFFQILIPAIQIALVLAVLTITVNPAGRSLPMRADIYDDTVTSILSDNATLSQSDDVRDHLKRMEFSHTTTNTSDALSEYMLDTYNEPEGDRFGGYVFNDEITVNVTVEWKWVQENIPFLLNNSALLLPLLDSLDLDLRNINIGNNNNSFLGGLNITSSTPAVDNALDAIFGNATFLLFNNVTIYRSNITDIIDSNEDFVIGDGGDVTYDSIDIIDGNIVLIEVEIVINNSTFDLGNITIAPLDVALLLPNETQWYSSVVATNYSVLQNSSSPHGVGVFISELVAAAFDSCRGGDATAVYSLNNHPLPLTIEQALEIQVILSVLASLFIIIPLSYIPANFVIFIVKERTSKSKHLQLVSGISPYLYWAASYLWDTTMYLLLAGFIMITFLLYGEEAAKIFIGSAEAGWAVYTMLVLYGLASIPLAYLYSMAFDNHSTAQISIMTWNFFTGFVFVLAYYIMSSIPSTEKTAATLVHFFRIFPPYNIGEGFINISVNYFSINILDGNLSYFAWTVTGRNLTYMACQVLVYFSSVLLTEVGVFRAVHGAFVKKYLSFTTRTHKGAAVLQQEEQEEEGGEKEDEDVVAERATVRSGDPRDYMLYINDIQKTYSSPLALGGAPKYAVRGIDLVCAAGERFGLLGINGAGKTTTLGMLTGDLQPTSGEAFISGLSLSDPQTRKLIGFCPQTDPLLELMTGWETLWFFGRVRGMSPAFLFRKCNALVDQVGLRQHASKPCGTYSGGNKRKLSLAVALIGNPKVLFLDEPSTGMDATAKRQMWDLINQVSAQRSVVLTTHSMEECEAICSRIGIMVSGRLKCLGSSQRLKHRFGASYEVNIRCPEEKRPGCITRLQEDLGSGLVEEEHKTYFRLKVDHDVDLSAAFSTLEALKSAQQIYEYSLSQSTLEQIFINFARDQDVKEGGRGE